MVKLQIKKKEGYTPRPNRVSLTKTPRPNRVSLT